VSGRSTRAPACACLLSLCPPPPVVACTRAQMTAYLQQQLWAIEQATQAERKYDSTLHSLISRAKDERRTVLQETNGATRPVDAIPIGSRSERLSQPLLCIAVWCCVVRSIATGLGAVEA
jgi:hypothetical protein